jgi:hypothetical protein
MKREHYSGTLAGRLRFRLKDGFDWLLEELCDAEGEGQAGIVFPAFDGIHGLPRHAEVQGEVCLRPVILGTQNAETVLHLSG